MSLEEHRDYVLNKIVEAGGDRMTIRTASELAASTGVSQAEFRGWLNENYPGWFTPKPVEVV